MANAEMTSPRSPRGTKPVSQAFLTALERVPAASRAAVAKAAQAMIRDELKIQRDKAKAIGVKQKALRATTAKKSAAAEKPAAAKSAVKQAAGTRKAPAVRTAKVAPRKAASKKAAAAPASPARLTETPASA